MDREAFVHFIGGAVGGTAGTAITCPLEVIKTRLQSSHGFNNSATKPADPGGGSGKVTASSNAPSTSQESSIRRIVRGSPVEGTTGAFRSMTYRHFLTSFTSAANGRMAAIIGDPRQLFACTNVLSLRCFHQDASKRKNVSAPRTRWGIPRYISNIIRDEGVFALYKGLLPNLVGVAPSKAVYFYTYSTSKRFWNESDVFVPNSAMVHMVSAGFAGFVTSTVINPVWLVKTRLQLHHGPLTISQCISKIYKYEGLRGFYKGVTASYMGISETIIQFVLYEHFRSMIDVSWYSPENTKFLNFMMAGGTAKFCACIITYPHEVVRTRLREENSKAKGFFKVLFQVGREGGARALYRGLSVQLLRAVPNTAITMGTYEMVIFLLHSYV